MAKEQLLCKWCGKKIPNRRHQVFCGKNPKRPAGASDAHVKAKREYPAPQTNGAVKPSLPKVPASGPIQAVHEPVPDEGMPDFSGIKGLDAPKPAEAPKEGEKKDPENPAVDVHWESLSDIICQMFDRAIAEEVDPEPKLPDAVTDDERKRLGQALKGTMEAYGGSAAGFFAKYGPALNLTFVAGSIFMGRLMQARDYKKHQLEEKKKGEKRREEIKQREPEVERRAQIQVHPEEDETSVGDFLIRQQRAIMAE